MKASISIILLLILHNSVFSQENIFIAKPYLQIGREPSPTSIELLWQVPQKTPRPGVEGKKNPHRKKTKREIPQKGPLGPAGLQPPRGNFTKKSGDVPGGLITPPRFPR